MKAASLIVSLIAFFVAFVGGVPTFVAEVSEGDFFCRPGGPCLRRIGDGAEGNRFSRGTGRVTSRGDGSDIELLDDGTIVFRDPSSSFSRGGRKWERKVNIEISDEGEDVSEDIDSRNTDVREGGDNDSTKDRNDERESDMGIGDKEDEHTINIVVKDEGKNGTAGFNHTTSLGDSKATANIQSGKVDGHMANREVKEGGRKDIDMNRGDRRGGVDIEAEFDEGKRADPVTNIEIKDERNVTRDSKSDTSFGGRKDERGSIAGIKGGKGDGRTSDIDLKKDASIKDIDGGKRVSSKNSNHTGSKDEGSNDKRVEIKDARKVIPGSNIDMKLGDRKGEIDATINKTTSDIPNAENDARRESVVGSGIGMNLDNRRDIPVSTIALGDTRKELGSSNEVAKSGSDTTINRNGRGSNGKPDKVERGTVVDRNSDIKTVDRPVVIEDNDGARSPSGSKNETNHADKKGNFSIAIDDKRRERGNKTKAEGGQLAGSNGDRNHDGKRDDRASKTKLGDSKVEQGSVLDNSNASIETKSNIVSNTDLAADHGANIKLDNSKVERRPVLDNSNTKPSGFNEAKGDARRGDIDSNMIRNDNDASHGSNIKLVEGKAERAVAFDRNGDFKTRDQSGPIEVKDGKEKGAFDSNFDMIGGKKGADRGSNMKKAERAALDHNDSLKTQDQSGPVEAKWGERRDILNSIIDMNSGANHGTKLDISDSSTFFEAKDGVKQDGRSSIKPGDGRVERGTSSDIAGFNRREGPGANLKAKNDDGKGIINSKVDSKLGGRKVNFESNGALVGDKEDSTTFIPLKDDIRKGVPSPNGSINRGGRRAERGTEVDNRREARNSDLEDIEIDDGSAFDRHTNSDLNHEARREAISGLNLDDDRVVERNFIQIGRGQPRRDPSRAKLNQGTGRAELNRGFNRDLDRGFGLGRF